MCDFPCQKASHLQKIFSLWLRTILTRSAAVLETKCSGFLESNNILHRILPAPFLFFNFLSARKGSFSQSISEKEPFRVEVYDNAALP